MNKVSEELLNSIYKEYCKLTVTFSNTFVSLHTNESIFPQMRTLIDAQLGRCNVDCKPALINKFINEDHGLLESFIASYLRADNRWNRTDYLKTICAFVSIYQKLRCAGEDQLLKELMTVTSDELMVVYSETAKRVEKDDITILETISADVCSSDDTDFYTCAMEYLYTLLSYRTYECADSLINKYLEGEIGMATLYSEFWNGVVAGVICPDEDVIYKLNEYAANAFMIEHGYDVDVDPTTNILYIQFDDPDFTPPKDFYYKVRC